MCLLRIALLAGILLAAAVLLSQIAAWRRNALPISRRQMALRVCEGILLIALLSLVLAGNLAGVLVASEPHRAVKEPLLTAVYLSACVGIACLLVFISLLDIREVLRTYSRTWREMRRDLEGKDGPEQ